MLVPSRRLGRVHIRPECEASSALEANHGGTSRAVVEVQAILDHVGLAGIDVDAGCSVATGTPGEVWRRIDVVHASC